jgi:hypothetical protein
MECRKLLKAGKDPIEVRNAKLAAEKVAKVKAPTFEWCATQYMKEREPGWRNAKHRQQWTNTLTTYVYPVIGKRPVDTIDTDMVLQIVQPIWGEKNETTSRIRGRIAKILDWAKKKKHRTGENPARWRGHLEFDLKARKDVHTVEHHRHCPMSRWPSSWPSYGNRKVSRPGAWSS